MKTIKFKAVALFATMVAAVAVGTWLKPKPLYTNGANQPKLAELVPAEFGDWKYESGRVNQIVSPDLQAQLNTLYSDTLSRTYVNSKGERVMLSLAYGADQGRSLKVHKPEFCYQAQGFKISSAQKDVLASKQGPINVMRLTADLNSRHEPITYWIRSGDDIVRGFVEQNIAVIGAGLKGYVADGILVRVSTISGDKKAAYHTQDMFIGDLLSSMSQSGRKMLLGQGVIQNEG